MERVSVITGLVLCLLASNLSFAKEIYVDESLGKEYLFLGSIEEGRKKWLDLQNNNVEWIENARLHQQSGQLTPGAFHEKITKTGLAFYAEGSEPHWNAVISEDELHISMPGEASQDLAIKVDMTKEPLDGIFLLMFQSEDHHAFGAIRKLWWDTPCELAITDEVSVFEVFISYRGAVVKGCARLDRE